MPLMMLDCCYCCSSFFIFVGDKCLASLMLFAMVLGLGVFSILILVSGFSGQYRVIGYFVKTFIGINCDFVTGANIKNDGSRN